MPRSNLRDRRGGDDDGPMFSAYGDDGPDLAMASRGLHEAGMVVASRDRFADIEPGISVKDGMDRRNFEFFRPGEHIPRRKNEVILSADNIYRYNGIVHFVLDMMADFVTQGVEVHHASPKLEKFYRAWWKKVNGHVVSERLVNLAYRHGVSVIKRTYAKMADDDVKDLHRGVASAARRGRDNETDFEPSIDPGRYRIPLVYTFLNPMMIEVLGGEISLFSGNPRYALRIPDKLARTIQNPKGEHEREAVANLPMYITSVVARGDKLVPLDREKVSILFYKKDDWQAWSDPLILSVMKDIILYDKMKEADRAALDGSISRKTLWNLGLPEHKIQPGPGAFRKLRDQLLAGVGGGSQDLIWDASLSFKETGTEVHKFLGSAKYEPVIQAIYAGLGIPQSLGGSSGGGGMTNNALSLKTLVERLTYARNMLNNFWEREFYQIQRAMGHRKPAMLRYDMMSFSDEASEKQLWLNLLDRDAVSLATVQERFGMLPEIEARRIRSEYDRRESGSVPFKLGPFTEAAPHPDGLAKAAMLQGTLAPTEAGVVKKPRAKGDKSLLDHQADQQDKALDLQKQQMDADNKIAEKQQKIDEKQGQDLHSQKLGQNDDLHQQRLAQKDAEHETMLPVKKQALKKTLQQGPKSKGAPGQGRPKGAGDTGPRKTRTPKPRVVKAGHFAVQVFARQAQATIAGAATAHFLEQVGKKNLRALSADEADRLESLKFAALCSIGPGESVTRESVEAILPTLPAPPQAFLDRLQAMATEASAGLDRKPTYDETREWQAYAYASVHTQPEGDSNDGQA